MARPRRISTTRRANWLRPAVWDHLPEQPLGDITSLVGRAAAAIIPVGGAGAAIPIHPPISTYLAWEHANWTCSWFQHLRTSVLLLSLSYVRRSCEKSRLNPVCSKDRPGRHSPLQILGQFVDNSGTMPFPVLIVCQCEPIIHCQDVSSPLYFLFYQSLLTDPLTLTLGGRLLLNQNGRSFARFPHCNTGRDIRQISLRSPTGQSLHSLSASSYRE